MADKKQEFTRTEEEVKLLEQTLAARDRELAQLREADEKATDLAGQAGTGTIHERLARARAQMHYIQRGGQLRSKAASFTYATIDQLREAVAPVLAAEGITMLPAEVETARSEVVEREREGDRGKYVTTQFDTVLNITWRFYCGWRPEADAGAVSGFPKSWEELRELAWTDVGPIPGRSLNSSDKDFNTAMTYSERNALLACFHLASGDDPEEDRPKVEGQRVAPRSAPGVPADHPGGQPPPSARREPPTAEQKAELQNIRAALGPKVTDGDDGLIAWMVGRSKQIGGDNVRGPGDLNRAEYEVLLSALREQAQKILPGFDTKTGEQKAAPAPEAPAAAEAPPEAPTPPASEQTQAAIEAAAEAARAAAGTDPDNPSGANFAAAEEAAKASGLDDATFLQVMLDAGAGSPADLDDGDVYAKVLKAIEAAAA